MRTDTIKLKETSIQMIDGDRGKNYPKLHEFNNEGHCLFLNTGNVTKEGFLFNSTAFITEEKDLLLRKGKLKRGDLVLTTRGTVGNVAVYNELVPFDHIRINSGMLILRVDPQDFLSEFLYYLFKSDIVQLQLEAFSYGAAQPQLPIGTLKHVKIPKPSIELQKKISSILLVYDNLIHDNLATINVLEQLAQTTYNEWFWQAEEVETWQEVELGSLISHEIGGGWGEEIKNAEFSEPAYVIRGTDMNELPNGKTESVPFRYHKESNLASRRLQDGDIIFEVSGGSSFEGVAKTLLITEELLDQFDNDVMCASFCKLMRPERREHTFFIYHFLQFLRQIKRTEVFEIRSASNIVNYNWKAFLKFQKVKKPSDNLIKSFNKVVGPIHKKIYNLGHQNQLLREARDILLPRLMTGMIDVDSNNVIKL